MSNLKVPEGYKLTSVGVIPEDWEVAQLGSLGSVIRGASPRPKGDKRYYGGNIPRLMVEDVTRDKKFVAPQIDFLTLEGAKRSRPCKQGTLTVVCSGTPSVVGLPSFLTVDACIHDGMMALVNISPKVFPDYLFHQLTSYQEQLYISATHGGTFVNLTTKGFRAFVVALPPSEIEQRSIAKTLSDIDALLSELDSLIAKKRDLKQTAIQQLLTGTMRLPRFDAEWTVKQLGNHLEFLRNGVNSRAELTTNDSIKYLHYGDIHASRSAFLCPSDLPSLPSKKAQGLSRLRDGDLVFADASEDLDGVGKSVEIFGALETECVSGLHTIALRFDKNILADGFKAYLQFCPTFYKKLHRLAAGTKVYATNRSHISNIEMRLPSTEEQNAIAKILSDMDSEISTIEQRRNKTRDLKHAMMQELLTGRIRLQ